MDVEKEIRRVLWGKSLVKAKDENDAESIYILRSLTIQEQNNLDFVYDNTFQEALDSNILTKEELELFYLNNEIWTEIDEQEVKKLELDIKKLTGQKSKIRANKVKINILTKKIEKLKEELYKLKKYKFDLYTISAEKHAEEVMNRHMIYMSVINEDGTPFWKSKEDFLDFTDEKLIYNLTMEYIKNNYLSEGDIRKIARSGSWRYRWMASKNGESLFGKPISEWSHMQNNLVYWSQYYDYIYENPDRPNDRIIEDDVALDQWMLDQSKENKKSSLGSKNKNKKTGEFIEEFVMIEDADPETIKEVYNQNPSVSRKIIHDTNKQVKEKGVVKDWYAKKDFRGGAK